MGVIRDRPFNLQGGLWFFFHSEICFRTTRELEYLSFFPQNLTLGYMTKTLNQIIFFSSTKIRIFFSATLGIRIFFLEKNNNPTIYKINRRRNIISSLYTTCAWLITKYLPATQAVKKHVIHPAIHVLTTISAIIPFFSGTSVPRPPTITPIVIGLENPHKAYVAITWLFPFF